MGHDVGLDGDRADDDGEEELLRRGARDLGPPGEVFGLGLDSGEDLGGAGLEGGEIGLVPNGCGLLCTKCTAMIRWFRETGRVGGGTLTTSAMPFENSRAGRVSRKAASMKMYLGCQNAPMRFFPCGVSIAVFPPTLESTMANKVVGICTKETPRILEAAESQPKIRGKRDHGTHKVAATKPTRSPTTPPPRARTTVSLVHLFKRRKSSTFALPSRLFEVSPGGTM